MFFASCIQAVHSNILPEATGGIVQSKFLLKLVTPWAKNEISTGGKVHKDAGRQKTSRGKGGKKGKTPATGISPMTFSKSRSTGQKFNVGELPNIGIQ